MDEGENLQGKVSCQDHGVAKLPLPSLCLTTSSKSGAFKLCYGTWNHPDVLPVGFSEGRATAHMIFEKLPIERKMNDLMKFLDCEVHLEGIFT